MTDDTIHRLPNAIVTSGEPNDEWVKLLEEQLEMAKNGKTVGGALCVVEKNDHIGSAWRYGDTKYWALLAAITNLYHRFISETMVDV